MFPASDGLKELLGGGCTHPGVRELLRSHRAPSVTLEPYWRPYRDYNATLED